MRPFFSFDIVITRILSNLWRPKVNTKSGGHCIINNRKTIFFYNELFIKIINISIFLPVGTADFLSWEVSCQLGFRLFAFLLELLELLVALLKSQVQLTCRSGARSQGADLTRSKKGGRSSVQGRRHAHPRRGWSWSWHRWWLVENQVAANLRNFFVHLNIGQVRQAHGHRPGWRWHVAQIFWRRQQRDVKGRFWGRMYWRRNFGVDRCCDVVVVAAVHLVMEESRVNVVGFQQGGEPLVARHAAQKLKNLITRIQNYYLD